MRVTWFGHSAFRLDFGGKAVLIDPFFTGNPAFVTDKKEAVKGVTHILLTHGHWTISAIPPTSRRNSTFPSSVTSRSACG